MPGFGHGPFGHDPFGEAAWSRLTLWELIPELHRSQDTSGLLQAFIEGLYPSFDVLRRDIRDFEYLRDPLKVRTQYDEVRRLKLGPRIIRQGDTEQSGLDGYVDALGFFHAASGRFRETEIGKDLFIRGSTIPGNNRQVTITVDVDLNTIATDPALAADPGKLRWEVREPVDSPTDYVTVEIRGGNVDDLRPGWLISDGLADFTVRARRRFAMVGNLAYQSEKEGVDGDIDATLRFAAATGAFTPQAIGKFLSISGSDTEENNRKFEIVDVDMSTTPPRLLLKGFLARDDGPLTWALLAHPQVDLDGQAVPVGVVEQEGTDGAFTGGGSYVFVSASASFDTSEDAGKYLDLRGSTASPSQNGQYKIDSVTDPNTVVLDTAFTTAETDIYWQLRSATTTGTVERYGVDLEITDVDYPVAGQSRVLVPSAYFDPSEVGLDLRIFDSDISGNNTTVTIVDVEDEEYAIVNATLALDDGPLSWELLSDDLTKANGRAESVIKFMAPDFGIEIDTQESEARQRSFVRHINSWLDLKGHEKSYEIIGSISGFNVDVFPVYHIAPSFVGLVDPIYEVSEEGEGRSGEDGELRLYGTVGEFYSATAEFRASDVGVSVRLFNCGDSDNNGLYHIGEYIGQNTVRFDLPAPTGTLPDYGATGTSPGSADIQWTLVRLYTDQPSAQPNFDEISSDTMEAWIDANPPAGDEFRIDKYCWEPDFAAFVTVTINSVTNLTGFIYEVNVTGQADVIPRDPGGPTRQVLDGSFWKLLDQNDDSFTVETSPLNVGGSNYTFEIISDPANLPATGSGVLQYRCSTVFSCDYCPASVVVATIEIGDVAEETGVAIERVLERVIQRLQSMPKPAHVRLIPIFKQTLEATLSITAEVITGRLVTPDLVAPITAYFDDIPADDIPVDYAHLLVTVDATDTVWGGGGD
jgi:hypothetical protein